MLVVAAGLVVHEALPGSTLTDIAGDALYTVAVYLGVILLWPRGRPLVIGGVAALWCIAVELLQLTGMPQQWGAAWPPLRLVLGSGFDARDLVVSAGASAACVAIDAVIARRGSRRAARSLRAVMRGAAARRRRRRGAPGLVRRST